MVALPTQEKKNQVRPTRPDTRAIEIYVSCRRAGGWGCPSPPILYGCVQASVSIGAPPGEILESRWAVLLQPLLELDSAGELSGERDGRNFNGARGARRARRSGSRMRSCFFRWMIACSCLFPGEHQREMRSQLLSEFKKKHLRYQLDPASCAEDTGPCG